MQEVNRYRNIDHRGFYEVVEYDRGPECCPWHIPLNETFVPVVGFEAVPLCYIVGPEHSYDPSLPNPGDTPHSIVRRVVPRRLPWDADYDLSDVVRHEVWKKEKVGLFAPVKHPYFDRRGFTWWVWQFQGFEPPYDRKENG